MAQLWSEKCGGGGQARDVLVKWGFLSSTPKSGGFGPPCPLKLRTWSPRHTGPRGQHWRPTVTASLSREPTLSAINVGRQNDSWHGPIVLARVLRPLQQNTWTGIWSNSAITNDLEWSSKSFHFSYFKPPTFRKKINITLYTIVHKMCHFIFDYNSRIWQNFQTVKCHVIYLQWLCFHI